MIDITPAIQRTVLRRATHRWDELVLRLEAFVSTRQGLTLDWDDGAGENWARIIEDKKPLALIWVLIPFSFVDPTAIELKRLLRKAGLEVVELSDFEEPVLSVNLDTVREVIKPNSWPDAIDPTRMSADDLWWATV